MSEPAISFAGGLSALAGVMARPVMFEPVADLARPRPAVGSGLAVSASGGNGDDRYAAGFADGQQAAETAHAAEREALLALVASAGALQPEASEELGELIGAAVEQLVRRIVESAPVDGDWLHRQAQAAAAIVAEADEQRCMRMHPLDAGLLAGCALPMPVETDATMQRGSIVIQTSSGWIEHGRAVFLDRLAQSLAAIGNPS